MERRVLDGMNLVKYKMEDGNHVNILRKSMKKRMIYGKSYVIIYIMSQTPCLEGSFIKMQHYGKC